MDIAHCGDDRLFVVSQDGWIRIVADSQVVLPRPFLDLSAQVIYSGEMGLLGLAFDPDYANNGLFYVNYISGAGGFHSRIARFHVSSDPDSADAASQEIIYALDQPYTNHKGGDLDFGPDGMLYIPFGDGGSGGDPENHAQNLTDALGDIIRIDVSDPDTTWTVPPDNPYVSANNDTLPEIWASGLRNPFRFGFDRLTGDLWLGDVGQNHWEEWDFWPAGDNSGPNFGWRCFEGEEAYNSTDCQIQSFYDGPAVVQLNDAIPGGIYCSAIGGRVYRGSQWPHLQGRYFYTDFCAPRFRNLRPDGSGGWLDEHSLATANSGYTCIAEDKDDELFVGNLFQGTIYRMLDRCPMDPPAIVVNGPDLETSTAPNYQWLLEGDTIPGAVQQTYVPVVNGNYQVMVDHGDQCVLLSDTVSFLTTGGMEHPGGLVQVSVLPNPANATLHVTVDRAGDLGYQLCDASGRVVLHGRIDGSGIVLGTAALAQGPYTVRVLDGTGSVIGRAQAMILH